MSELFETYTENWKKLYAEKGSQYPWCYTETISSEQLFNKIIECGEKFGVENLNGVFVAQEYYNTQYANFSRFDLTEKIFYSNILQDAVDIYKDILNS